MRSLRTTLAVAGLLGIAPAFAGAQNLPAAKDLLGLSPDEMTRLRETGAIG